MAQSPLRLIKNCSEFIEKDRISELPGALRGIYVLYNYDQKGDKYNVVYVGMARVGMRGRLWSHARSHTKRDLWGHFSAFEVWDNIRDEEITELEGLFRHIYRRDAQAMALNKQRGYKALKKISYKRLSEWVKFREF